jgi:signal transduction histidine kinase
VRISAPQLRALVENSLSNALKYSPENLPVKIILAGDESAWTITVIDQGRGIPKADLPNLFKPFARASNVGNVPGIGLGLVIISRILKRYGGSIRVDSAVGRGTSFVMEIPHQ